ncbi:MAG TPA: hypothetical protein DD416_01540 [Rhodobacteraceae bacterium]|jgi:uncharacterized protein YndB with AHSA1/START domain|nr:SRPBCC domain-containing protein [Pseudomonadota bacterium]NQW12911.1 SRPBCC domain-containing protein [Rhodobacter sp.]HBN29924.1 hypothetical protein [Paracoccaceae bacterium]
MTDRKTITFDRRIKAPVAVVWNACTDPKILPTWWGPKGFSCKTKQIDLRDGCIWRFDMIGPDGAVYPNRQRYTAYEKHRLIAYILDDDGGGMPPIEATIAFAANGDATLLTLTMRFATPEACEGAKAFGAVELGKTTFAKLAALVE